MTNLTFIVALLSISVGLGWVSVFLLLPIPVEMESLGWEMTVFPLFPGAMLVFLGVQFFLEYRKVPIRKLAFVTLPLAVYLAAVIVSVYFIFMSDLPALHNAFNWTLYLLLPALIAYKAEQVFWIKYGNHPFKSGDP